MNKIESRKDEQQIVSDLLENVINVSERMENVLDEGWFISPSLCLYLTCSVVTEKEYAGFKFLGLQDRLSKRVGDFKQRLEVFPRYNWDFDNYLEEDIPSAVRWHLLFCYSSI